MEKTKSTVTPVITELGKDKTSLEILSTNDVTVQLDGNEKSCLENVEQASKKKESRIRQAHILQGQKHRAQLEEKCHTGSCPKSK